MKKLILLFLLLNTTIFAGIPMTEKFIGPTESLVKRESWDRIKRKLLDMKISPELFPFFDSIAETEHWGHIGYHGSNQGFRIYQDIIKFTLEEIMGIQIRNNFHFLRVPGDPDLNLNSIDEFAIHWDGIDEKNDLRPKQLISLNFGIYSNFDEKGSCSVNFFVKDKSKNE